MMEQEAFPGCLEIIARTQDERDEMEDIMDARHKILVLEGVEFQS